MTADVGFLARSSLEVRSVTRYRDGRSIDEAWQTDPPAAY